MSSFSISRVIADIGETVSVVDISRAYNKMGDLSGASYSYYSDTAVVEQVDVNDDEVKEGILKPNDIIAYFDEATSVANYLKVGNILSGSFFTTTSRSYEIKGVFKNKGHYQVNASKL